MSVVVVGDAMRDVWSHYSRTRDNPEQPGTPVLVWRAETQSQGGALNVVENLRRCYGRRVTFVDSGRSGPITTKIRVVVDGRVVARIDDDNRVERVDVERVGNEVAAARPSAIVLVDYGKGAVTFELVDRLIAMFPRTLTVLDLKPTLHRELLGRSWIHERVVLKANGREATEILDHLGPDQAQRWARSFGFARPLAVITQGARGALWARAGSLGSAEMMMPPARSVCGAGDVFTAVLTDRLLAGDDDADAVFTAADRASRLATTGDEARTLVLP